MEDAPEGFIIPTFQDFSFHDPQPSSDHSLLASTDAQRDCRNLIFNRYLRSVLRNVHKGTSGRFLVSPAATGSGTWIIHHHKLTQNYI